MSLLTGNQPVLELLELSLLTGNQPVLGAARDVSADRTAGQYLLLDARALW
jgi:hypothetical protein